MPQTLDYAATVTSAPPRWLTRAANVTLAYPLLFLACLYGQWLLSWYMLGHRPRPSLDDPKYIEGANWIQILTELAFLGLVPFGLVALVLNAVYATRAQHRSGHLVIRVLVGLVLWIGTFLLLRWDPGLVLYWWFD